MDDEIFGPILPIVTYSSLDEAFARIAATPHPLSAFIFSRDQATIDRFIGELSYGGGTVNRTNTHLFHRDDARPWPKVLAPYSPVLRRTRRLADRFRAQ